jgi:hypothetical protein
MIVLPIRGGQSKMRSTSRAGLDGARVGFGGYHPIDILSEYRLHEGTSGGAVVQVIGLFVHIEREHRPSPASHMYNIEQRLAFDRLQVHSYQKISGDDGKFHRAIELPAGVEGVPAIPPL